MRNYLEANPAAQEVWISALKIRHGEAVLPDTHKQADLYDREARGTRCSLKCWVLTPQQVLDRFCTSAELMQMEPMPYKNEVGFD